MIGILALRGLPEDKLLHMTYGIVIFSLLLSAGLNYNVAYSIVFVIAVSKEVLDYYGNGTPDIYDIAFTMLLPSILGLVYGFMNYIT